MILRGKKETVTDKLLKLRECAGCVEEPTPGVWFDDFTTTKDAADRQGVPFIAVWTNGDKCGFCVKLEECFLDPKFIAWQKNSGCIFWLGCSADDPDKEDGTNGKGFKWIWQNGKVTAYPFVRVWWPKGKVDVSTNGNVLDGRKKAAKGGTDEVLRHFKTWLKDFKPAPVKPADVPPPPPPPPSVDPEPPAPPAPPPPPMKDYKIVVNPDITKEEADEIRQKIKENDGYCPCQPKAEDTKCMCANFKGMKIPEGEQKCTCVCGLYCKIRIEAK